ncbi:hypothetical protein BKP42_67870 [Rhodococcus erythropolis]|nr:hypothetical protein BKP42_67870 [Rhodococcus erythropolis]
MAESVEINVPNARDQIRKGRIYVDLGAKDQCVDEHPDDVVENLLTTARHRSTDHDIRSTRQPSQQHRQGAVKHHEQ